MPEAIREPVGAELGGAPRRGLRGRAPRAAARPAASAHPARRSRISEYREPVRSAERQTVAVVDCPGLRTACSMMTAPVDGTRRGAPGSDNHLLSHVVSKCQGQARSPIARGDEAPCRVDLCPTCARQGTAHGAAELDHGSVVCATSASARWCRAARGRRPVRQRRRSTSATELDDASSHQLQRTTFTRRSRGVSGEFSDLPAGRPMTTKPRQTAFTQTAE